MGRRVLKKNPALQCRLRFGACRVSVSKHRRECGGSKRTVPGQGHVGAVLGPLRNKCQWQPLEARGGGERAAQGGRLRFHSSGSSRGGGGGFHPRGGCGHGPQGRPIGASEGEQCSARNKTKTKKCKKKTQKHSQKVLLIGQPWGSCILG